MTGPARFGICVNGGFGDSMLFVDIGTFVIGAGWEDRGVPITVVHDVSFMIIQLMRGCWTYSEDSPLMT